MDKFKVTQDQKIYLGEKEVEFRVIVESADIQNYQAIPKQTE